MPVRPIRTRHLADCILVGCAVWSALVGVPRVALADEPAQEPAGESAQESANAAAEMPDDERWEMAGLPSASWDSDLGASFGLRGSLARFEPGWRPYRWRLAATAFIAIRDGGGSPEVPLYAGYLRLDLPSRGGDGVRLDARLVARRALADYYGIGTASSGVRPADAVATAQRYFRYWRLWLGLEVGARIRLTEDLHLRGRGSFAFNRIDPTPGGTLDLDRKGRSGSWVEAELAGTGRHGVLEGAVSIEWDTRDSEPMPTRGLFLRGTLRGGLGDDRIAFLALETSLRAYASLVDRWLILAARVEAEWVVGRRAFYDLPIIGSFSSVRGVPWRRFQGKARVLANVEIRSRLLRFELLGQRFVLGLVAFADAGRVFADPISAPSSLDEPGHGLQIGLGGGARLLWGSQFVIRFDAAWSPLGHGLYLGAGHVF